MGQESDRYRGEAGELLVEDLDRDVVSKQNEPKKHVLDVASERSPTPVALKRRNLKPNIVSDASSGGQKKENRKSLGKKRNAEWDKESRQGIVRDRDADSEIKEMWDTIVSGNPEDDQEAVRTVADDKIVDDKGGEPSNHYGSESSDNKHSPSQAPQAEAEAEAEAEVEEDEEEEDEEDEIHKLFMIGKRKKKETSHSEIVLLVEKTVAELQVAADEDAELNRQEKPAITKLRNLSLLTDIIPRQHLQQEFLDRGVLDALKAWLEPLPDKSMPNVNVRSAVFKCLSDLKIDLEQSVRREQMKKSGIGKAVMFYCKYDKETNANRKAAKELVDKWSRAIYNISTRYEDMEIYEEERSYKRPPVKKYEDIDIEIYEENRSYKRTPVKKGPISGSSSSSQHVSKPEAISMDFAVRPKSKVDPDAVRAEAKQKVQGYHRSRLNKRLQRRKAPKQQQAVKANP